MAGGSLIVASLISFGAQIVQRTCQRATENQPSTKPDNISQCYDLVRTCYSCEVQTKTDQFIQYWDWAIQSKLRLRVSFEHEKYKLSLVHTYYKSKANMHMLQYSWKEPTWKFLLFSEGIVFCETDPLWVKIGEMMA